MAMTSLQGPVTHYQQSTETSGYVNQGQGQIRTAQVLTFRVNNRPVTFKSPSGTSISNGDSVTAIGGEKAGTFHAICMRNETTGAIFAATSTLFFVLGGLLLLLGIPLSFIILGIPFVIIGAICIYMGWRNMNANKMLEATRAIGGASVAHAPM